MKKLNGIPTALALVAFMVVAAVAATQLTASSTIFGQPTATSSAFGSGANNLYSPGAVFVDGSGRVWVCDQTNSRVLIYNSIADTKAQWALSTTNDTGSAGQSFNAADTQFGAFEVSYIKGTNAQFVAIADSITSRVLVWVWAADSPLSQVLNKNVTAETKPVIVLGQYSFTGSQIDSALNSGSDSALSLVAHNVTALTFGAAPSGDTIYLYVATDSSTVFDGPNRIYRFPLRDTFLHNAVGATVNGTGRESAVLSYSRTTTVPTPFGQAPKADLIFGDTIGTSNARLRQPNDLAFFNNSLYVVDLGNNRVLRYDTANALYSIADTFADGVYGQGSFTTSNAWFIGSDTGLRFPSSLAVSSAGGLVVADFPSDVGGGRVVVFDGSDSRVASRWFGMDLAGNAVVFGATNASTVGPFPSVGTSGSTVLVSDTFANRVLLLSGAVSAAGSISPVATSNGACVIGRAAAATGSTAVLPSMRALRDCMLSSPFGRLLVEGYYFLGMALIFFAGAGVALTATAARRR